ncbi:MAG TPA: type I restriction-modification system subunit M, partial [Gammaproteobacteria bacterium]|nr:type I restriction-modification system subunit M [Gammaproteobacteria bacterium]
QVDPNIVTKKVKGKEAEVQEGWKGHILPFDLVQQVHLHDELQALQANENRLAEIASDIEALLDSMTEDDKAIDTVNDSGDAFVNAAVAKAAKQIKADLKASQQSTKSLDADSYQAKIIAVEALIAEEKALKKTVKSNAEKLHTTTKSIIENLQEEQVYSLLELKWITPLLQELNKLPANLIQQLTSQVQKLADKYAVTYADVAQEISATEKTLASMIDELTGNEFDMQGLAEFKAFLLGE